MVPAPLPLPLPAPTPGTHRGSAGVPFMIGEPSDTKTFRIGLFGLDKLKDPEKTASILRGALDKAVPDEVVKNLSGYIKNDKSLKKAMK